MTPIEANSRRCRVKPQHQAKPIFPSVSYLAQCSMLLLDANDMAVFLQIHARECRG